MNLTTLLQTGTLWKEFEQIFTGQFAWITITLMIIGLALCVVEALVPGFGFFGICGVVCEIASVVTHAILCKGQAIQIVLLVLLLTLVTLLLFLIMVRSAKHGLLGKTPFVENDTAIPINYGEKAEEKLKSLILGKEGITLTDLHPVGKIRIDQEVYEVCSKGSLIQKGEVVKVVEIEDSIIYVSKLNY